MVLIRTKCSTATGPWAFYTQNCLASWVREVRIRCLQGKRSEIEATVFTRQLTARANSIEIDKFDVHGGLSDKYDVSMNCSSF